MALPEGYIANSADDEKATVYAVDSETLSRNGEVHLPGDHDANQYGLDAHVEFSIKDDPRLEALKEKAKEMGESYKNIKDVGKRELFIVNELNELIHETYGDYNHEIVPASGEYKLNPEEEAAFREGRTAQLSDMEKGDMVCRHFAPIMSVLLHEAGVPNHMVASKVGDLSLKDGKYSQEGEWGAHAYVITYEGNAVVEATVDKNSFCYHPIENDVTALGIVLGGEGAICGYSVYGGEHYQESLDKYNSMQPKPYDLRRHEKEIKRHEHLIDRLEFDLKIKDGGKLSEESQAKVDEYRDTADRYAAMARGSGKPDEERMKELGWKIEELNDSKRDDVREQIKEKHRREINDVATRFGDMREKGYISGEDTDRMVGKLFDANGDGVLDKRETTDMASEISASAALRRALGGDEKARQIVESLGERLKEKGVSGVSVADIGSLGDVEQKAMPKEQIPPQEQVRG